MYSKTSKDPTSSQQNEKEQHRNETVKRTGDLLLQGWKLLNLLCPQCQSVSLSIIIIFP